MKLFWKIYIAGIITFSVVIAFLSIIHINIDLDQMKAHLIESKTSVALHISKELESEARLSRWPFEVLRDLSRSDDFLFWWIVRDDGIIHLANRSSFISTIAADYFPEAAHAAAEEGLFLNRKQSYGLLVSPIEVENRSWTFWFGFSTEALSKVRNRIYMFTLASFVSSMALLGIIMYFTIGYFTRSLQSLADGAARVGAGDLTHTVQVASNDEIGFLADSFNTMAGNLQETMVSKEYVDSIISSMIDPLFVLDSEARIIMVNPAVCMLLEYQEEELISRPVSFIFSEECDIEHSIQQSAEPSSNGRIPSSEISFRAKNGSTIPIILSSSMMLDKTSQRAFTVCTAKDITDQKKIEEELRLQGEITANMSEGVIMVRADDATLLYVNPTFCRMFGYDSEELVGQHVSILNTEVPGKTPEQVAEEIMKEVFTEGLWRGELCNQRKDGTPFWCYASVTLFEHSLYGQVMIAAHMDITSRKKAEEKIRWALQEKEILLREVHHRVKNNLQTVASLLRLQVSAGGKEVSAKDILTDCQRRIHAIAFIHEKLYQSSDLRHINLGEYLGELAEHVLKSAEASRGNITLVTDTGLVRADIDTAIPCGLIINELVNNAVQHAFADGRGEIRLTVSPEEQGAVTITMSDDGAGLPEGFDIEQVESLGLQLVRDLTEEQLKGVITIDRTGGTRFTISFPPLTESGDPGIEIEGEE